MKQKILKTLALGLLLVSGVNGAWADNTVRYSTDGGTTWTETESLNDLNGDTKLFGTATTDVLVEVSANQTLSSRITWKVAHTLTITPTADITIKGPAGAMWFLANVADAKIIMGNNTYKITLDGENKSHTSGDITRRESNGSVSLTNITFKDFNLNSATHLCSSKSEGNADGLILENITIENCTNPETAYIYSDRVVNDVIKLKGYLNVDEKSTGITIRTKLETKASGTTGRIKVDDSSAALTATKTITITFTEQSSTLVPKIGAAIVVNSTKNFTDETAAIFALANDVAYGTYRQNRDLKLTQAYTLAVSEAKASTLILPFEAKIPADVTAYTLTYTSGAPSVTATPVETTLAANTPVLINAEAGAYKFVSTATSGDLATGSDAVTSGALTGVYAKTVPGEGHYILTNHSGVVGFRKTKGTSKVAAYRAYLTASGGGSREFLDIDFSEDNVTAIKNVKVGSEDHVYYDLQGRRVLYPKKGLYIVNGKKVIIK
ncbi:MAG: hypothetical protein IJV09_04640 [Prevotella sp.]|nr:hypothetical protein [Prevotella sp.]